MSEDGPIWDRPAAPPPPAAVSGNDITPAPLPHRWGRLLLACGASGLAGLVVGLVIGLAAGGTTTSTAAGHTSPAASAAPVAIPSSAPVPPSPAPSPDASGTGSCDVSLSTGNGPNYLVSEVDVTNTVNVGAVVKVRVSWPQVGFAPIVKHKTVRVPYGQTVHVNLSVNASNYSSDIIGNFQNYQLSHSGDPCS